MTDGFVVVRWRDYDRSLPRIACPRRLINITGIEYAYRRPDDVAVVPWVP